MGLEQQNIRGLGWAIRRRPVELETVYFYSIRRVQYLRITALHILAFLLFGPLAAAVFGLLEIAALYLLVLLLPPEPALLVLFHVGYLLAGVMLFAFSMRVRHYQYAPESEVRGRFRRRATLWH